MFLYLRTKLQLFSIILRYPGWYRYSTLHDKPQNTHSGWVKSKVGYQRSKKCIMRVSELYKINYCHCRENDYSIGKINNVTCFWSGITLKEKCINH